MNRTEPKKVGPIIKVLVMEKKKKKMVHNHNHHVKKG